MLQLYVTHKREFLFSLLCLGITWGGVYAHVMEWFS